VLATFIIWLKNEQSFPSEELIFLVDDESSQHRVIITAVLFLILGMYVEFLYLPDYPDFKEVLTI